MSDARRLTREKSPLCFVAVQKRESRCARFWHSCAVCDSTQTKVEGLPRSDWIAASRRMGGGRRPLRRHRSSRHAVSGASARPLPPSHVTDDRSRRLQHPRTTPPRHPLPRVHADRRALARPLGVPDHRLSRECVSRRGIPPEPPSRRGAIPVVVVRVHRRGRTIHRPPPLDDHSAGGHRRRRRLRGDRHRR